MKAAILAALDALLCLIRKFWRPLTCIGIAGSLIVNGIVIPLWTKSIADLPGLAALVASLTPFVAARAWEKTKGVSE